MIKLEQSTDYNLVSIVDRAVEGSGASDAVVYKNRRYSYADLNTYAARIATGLLRRGVRRGSRVGLFLPNCPEFVLAYLAIARLGAIAVSIDAKQKEQEVRFILSDCGAVALITDLAHQHDVPQGAPELNEIIITDEPAGPWDQWLSANEPVQQPSEVSPDHELAILYTSGTTGRPKGATLTHGNVLFTARQSASYCTAARGDRLLLVVPLSHCFGQNVVLNQALWSGATVVLMDTFEPAAVTATIAREKISMVFGVPTLYSLLAEHCTDAAQLQSVRYCHSGADILPASIAARWTNQFGLSIHQGYGLTESSPLALYNPRASEFPLSVGKPIEGVEVDLIDEKGLSVAGNEPGQIVVRGPNVMKGYWNRPEETAAAIQNGWLRTGDVGRRDEFGNFYVVDRIKDMINVGGLKVFPAEVETVLKMFPGVRDAAVFSIPDTVLGELVQAVCIPENEPPEPSELMSFCRIRLADFKVPTRISFATSLPRNAKGKLLRRVLRETQCSLSSNTSFLLNDTH